MPTLKKNLCNGFMEESKVLTKKLGYEKIDCEGILAGPFFTVIFSTALCNSENKFAAFMPWNLDKYL